ncbi:Bug family tripartite tricarboxylate transporter substrate binding protein [Limnohabitans sp. 63ED37-2]|uniref:Bug family tripartite tricarboxylate transporter substrate binding protein n=1 Tax=Limnohabitans sp. 63ED37-2 TaxID=1678128 RepID=UPI0007061A3B|nr:tripartite tricarboxylate transporter substrate binding protein [Limnohabitans sp. 63ED37-2]ALK89234.1 Tripartite tricarboxylate transporter family receptor [Limnohabitans sp. 63ED37-2]
MKKPFLLAALAAVLMTPTVPAWAQASYPTKPIKIVVPFPAGGTSDVLARIVGQKMTESWGQPVVIENRPGSSGNLGADLVAKSPADGHTLVLMDVGNLVISPALFKLPFNVEKDFAPVAMVAYSPHLLAVSTKVPANTPAELVAYAKAQKGKLNYAVAAGMGSASHLAGVMYAQRNGIEWGYVPYKGGAQAITDLIGGQVDVMFNGMVATYPHVKAGKIKLIAISSNQRNAQMPGTPTVAESLPGFLTGSFQGLLAPAGTPKAVVDKLNAEVQRIAALPEIKERLTALGAEPSGMTPDQFGQWMRAEIPAMAKIVKDEKITVE